MIKFKNKKTGKIFDSIIEAYRAFRCPGPCDDCALQKGTTCSQEWIQSHPSEAAKLMGYKIIDDMEFIPNIAKILQVDVGQDFYYPGNGTFYHITPDGKVVNTNGTPIYSTNELISMINHPNLIVPQVKWTQADIEDAKALTRVYKDIYDFTKISEDNCIKITFKHRTSAVYIPGTHLFPSALFDLRYFIDKILKGENSK